MLAQRGSGIAIWTVAASQPANSPDRPAVMSRLADEGIGVSIPQGVLFWLLD